MYYLSNTSPLQVTPVQPMGRIGAGEVIWYVNGVLTNPIEQFNTMKAIANRSGHPVIGIRNTSYGYGSDFGQAGLDLIGSPNNPATETLTNALYNELKKNDTRGVHLFAHSQGTEIVNNAIKGVKRKFETIDKLSFCQVLNKLSLIKAEIFGSPVSNFVNGPAYIHICNYEDPVCNAFGFGQRGWRKRKDNQIEDEIRSSEIKKSKTQADVYGANSYVFNFNRDYPGNTPGTDHSIDNVYIPNRGAAIFPLPPVCSAKLFLFDTSGSMADAGKWDGELKSALEALKNYEDLTEVKTQFFPTTFLSFAGECSENSVKKLFDFDVDVAKISKQLPNILPRPGGSTPLYISFDVAINILNKYLKDNPYIEEKSLYVLSDGEDTCEQSIQPSGSFSGYGKQSGKKSALLANLPQNTKVYSIGYDLPAGSKGERDLQYMAFVSGGKYYNAADARQLKRALQKLTQSYFPKNITLSDSQLPKFQDALDKAGIALQKKKAEEALKLYRKLEADFKRDGIISPELYFNIAQSLEANDRYKSAVEYYQLYLKSNAQTADKTLVEQKIVTLKQDYKDQFEYYLKVIESDLTYLKKYYKDLFNQNNNALAAEFAGFVTEKGEFYTNLQDILEIQDVKIKDHSKDLSDGLYDLSDRIDSPSFDRDAVSLLTVPIDELEQILGLLKTNKTKFLNN